MRVLILSAALAAAALPARAGAPELIGAVDSATVRAAGRGAVEVCAQGTVPTGGWTGARLAPAALGPAPGGIYTLDFMAVRPDGLATQMVSHISACLLWRTAPAALKGVTVRGDRASATAMLGGG